MATVKKPPKLTREEKLKLLDLLEEKKRRKLLKKDSFVPNEGQLPVHQSTATLRCVFSGNGAGKTTSAVHEALWTCNGYNPILKAYTPVPARVIVLLDHPEKVADLWLPEIRKWINLDPKQCDKRGKPYYTRIWFENGSEILFMFHQQEPTLFESIELDMMIADEPPPRHIYISLRRGGRKQGRKPKFLIVGTPITGTWMRTEIQDPWVQGELKDTECFRFGTIVNEANLAKHFIESFSSVLSEKEKRIRLYGEFFDLDGLALAHLFDRRTHVVEPFTWPNDRPVVIAVDPHGSKPHHALMLGVDEDNHLFVLKEFNAKMVAREFARALKQWYQGYRVVDHICDSYGSAEHLGGEGFKSFIQVLNEEGVRIRPTTWDDKKDEDFIDRIKTVLCLPSEPDNFGQRIPKLRIFNGNHGIIRDIENVQWIKFKNADVFKPKLDISNKDFLACLKYALASNLTYDKTKSKIYRRVGGAETYGIQPTHKNKDYYVRKLGLKKLSLKAKKKKVESWEDF